VVKRQAIDIFEAISLPIWQRNIVQTSCRNRKWQGEPLSRRRSIGLPLIPVECGNSYIGSRPAAPRARERGLIAIMGNNLVIVRPTRAGAVDQDLVFLSNM
jgi:hypothetical protein